ncbi:ORC ubiquitin ligase 1 [Pygocentrus nattereri]|uniref:ORC ubiquitin ligase 1 n=1 Tax=Pygocentrus nattereri TaxID=42514 RepID=UPI0018916D0B|nr:ORC ubiquitin ligase 1 [Pygocentrus nattereri]
MAQSCQSVTLSLTLPIACQICLGKVRKPKICSNSHVFCSTCIDVWLQKCSQCPTCRVAVTPENPCREIIGATNDSESNENHSVKRRLRKTRGELILQEYEDEIETLLKENEDLRSKNLSLETQLKTALEPSTLFVAQTETEAVDPSLLQESAKKLKAANELYQKVKQDVEKLKEANKTLRSQNVDLIQENMRLKAEVESRSPQKFGRYTVAALEAKILQQEREMTQLKKALERSDKYIEELEAQVSKSRREGANTTEDSQSKGSVSGGTQAAVGGASTGSSSRIAAMRRSLSEMEEASVCTDLERKSINLPNSHGFLLTTSDTCRGIGFLNEALSPRNDALQNITVPVPSTPSSAFSSLSLRSPAVCSERKPSFKRLTYLRRLSFDDCSSSSSFSASASVDQSSKAGQVDKDGSFSHRNVLNTGKEALWSGWQDIKPASFLSANENSAGFKQRESEDGSSVDEAEASEASMDLAYLDKISELDSMMAEGEPSHHSPLLSHPPACNAPLTPKLEAHLDVLADPGSVRKQQRTSDAQDGSRNGPECSGESTKRKCSVSLASASPSKMSKMK